jgi:alpha-tubulin suppressor-like RCC1 family protein
MTTSLPPSKPTTETTTRSRQLTRRTAVAAAAWSVPVVAAAVATPAHATSGDSALHLALADGTLTAGAATTVTTTVLTKGGAPWAGQTVTLSLSRTDGVALGVTTGQTDSLGRLQTTLSTSAAAAAGDVVVTAASGPLTTTTTLTVTVAFTVPDPEPVIMSSAYRWGEFLPTQGALDPWNSLQPTPIPVPSFPTGVTHAAQAGMGGVLRTSDGSVYAWGITLLAQLTGSPRAEDHGGYLMRKTDVRGAKSVAAGFVSAFAVMEDGTVRAWGQGVNGLFAQGSTAVQQYTSSIQLPHLSDIAELQVSGYTALARTSSGALYGWGTNTTQSLFAGENKVATPTPVSHPLLTDIKRIALGTDTAAALRADGSVVTWGHGLSTPTVVPWIAKAIDVSVYFGAGYAILEDGTLQTWEIVSEGWPKRYVVVQPAKTGVFAAADLTGVKQIALSGERGGYALLADGTVKAWGLNQFGQLGNGTKSAVSTDRFDPVTVTLPKPAVRIAAHAGDFGYAGLALF